MRARLNPFHRDDLATMGKLLFRLSRFPTRLILIPGKTNIDASFSTNIEVTNGTAISNVAGCSVARRRHKRAKLDMQRLPREFR